MTKQNAHKCIKNSYIDSALLHVSASRVTILSEAKHQDEYMKVQLTELLEKIHTVWNDNHNNVV